MGKTYFFSHRLQFYCTNTIEKYEALVHGLLMALRKKVKMLQVFGDSELVVKQARKLYSSHDRTLENYRHRVWNIIEGLDAFNIQLIPYSKNQTTNVLAQVASTLQPLSLTRLKKFTIELTSTRSVPDNVTNFQVSNDDKHILNFITRSNVFATQIIDEAEPEEAELDIEGVINLKTNMIP